MFQEEQQSETHELAKQMITRIQLFGSCEGFSDEDLEDILNKVKLIFEPLPAMIEICSPVIVFGDVHGQLSDMLSFIDKIGRPPSYQYLFLGDIVDRGTRSLETIFWIFCMKILYPDKIHVIRGNHEVRRVNALYGFREEMSRKRSVSMWKIVNDVFSEMPICANINRKILCMHGGVNSKIENWASLENLKKPRKFSECEDGLTVDLLWADPNRKSDECKFNTKRGISTYFSKSAVHDICSALSIDLIIRAHEMKIAGHEFQFDNQLLTIFSAPHYSGNNDNSASIAKISRSLKLQIMTLKPKMGLNEMKAEKEGRRKKLNFFDPEDRKHRRLCHAYAGSTDSSSTIPSLRKFLDFNVMHGHDTKYCQTVGDTSGQNSRESSMESIDPLDSVRRASRRAKIPGKAVNLRDDDMSIQSIRQKLGILAAEANKSSAEDSSLMVPTKSATPTPKKKDE
ncbi:unnamed protein product [Caenorhabditis angaria]|uniref:Serine/threonine-protein phosphatase n=1 Tax=Caenorhabditis angaria TaxID=860376 RepID=A0A9P1N3B1_9PELO|nr:unnamed protein product [Caenorhabditis angaria]